MSSVSPESSASQRPAASQMPVVQPFDFAGFSEILKVARSEGKVDVDALSNRFIGAYYAYLRAFGTQSGSVVGSSLEPDSSGSSKISTSSGSKVSIGSVSSGFKGSALARFKSLRAKTSWRPGFVPSSNDGYCYLQAIRMHKRDEVKENLGPWPTMFSLLTVSRNKFRPERKLQGLRMNGSATTAHLSDGKDGYPFFSAMVDIASKACTVAASDSMYAVLRNKEVSLSTPFRGSTQLGGSLPPVKSLEMLDSGLPIVMLTTSVVGAGATSSVQTTTLTPDSWWAAPCVLASGSVVKLQEDERFLYDGVIIGGSGICVYLCLRGDVSGSFQKRASFTGDTRPVLNVSVFTDSSVITDVLTSKYIIQGRDPRVFDLVGVFILQAGRGSNNRFHRELNWFGSPSAKPGLQQPLRTVHARAGVAVPGRFLREMMGKPRIYSEFRAPNRRARLALGAGAIALNHGCKQAVGVASWALAEQIEDGVSCKATITYLENESMYDEE